MRCHHVKMHGQKAQTVNELFGGHRNPEKTFEARGCPLSSGWGKASPMKSFPEERFPRAAKKRKLVGWPVT